jgi:hypothetical protein
MRTIVGLDQPTAGSATVNGKPYARHRSPQRGSTAVVVTVSLTVLLILPNVLQIIGLDWVQAIVNYVPWRRRPPSSRSAEPSGGTSSSTPGKGSSSSRRYAVVPLVGAGVPLPRRDV